MDKKSAWDKYNEADLKNLNFLCDEYKQFLNHCKTEREVISEIVKILTANGYVNLKDIAISNKKLKAGDKVFAVNMNKSIVIACIGEQDLKLGINLLGAHIDSPRIDIKQSPLYEPEKSNFVMLDTHYYGGIKNYQWVTMPLAMHGVVVKPTGEKIELKIGEKEDDPVFCITDILPHLGSQQLNKKANEFIEAESLDVLVGNIPVVTDDVKITEKFKENILQILNKKYNINEVDFYSSEIEMVPAYMARDCGLDSSMVIGYGQDDRVCVYLALKAMLATKNTKKTTMCVFVDKEEIGSVGATGMQSKFFENIVAEIINLKQEKYNELDLRRCLANSYMLSNDVTAGYDPNFEDYLNFNTESFLGCGVSFNKYTGSRGKSNSNDANPEYIAKIRKVLEENNVTYQITEMGKVDAGGGGTIAYILAAYGMEVIDCGVALLNMHSPAEIVSKADMYEAYKCYKLFLEKF